MTSTPTIPYEPEDIQREETEEFRAASLAQRARLLAIACRSAARLRQSRLKAGRPDLEPDPWPESTWQFLNEQASDGRRQAT